MTDLAKPVRARLAEKASLGRLEIDLEQVSRDGTRKLRLKTHDGRMIETVLIPDGDAGGDPGDDGEDAFRGGRTPASRAERGEVLRRGRAEPDARSRSEMNPRRPKLTQCVSSQVGCALDCSF